jgi:hypothetical protein
MCGLCGRVDDELAAALSGIIARYSALRHGEQRKIPTLAWRALYDT